MRASGSGLRYCSSCKQTVFDLSALPEKQATALLRRDRGELCVVGTRYARFGSFAFGPRALWAYLRGAVTGRGERHTGHNPGSGWAIYAMLALSLGLAFTGAFMSRGGELLEELHEVFAWAMIAVVATHVAGIIWHTLRHRENIARSMVDGRKLGDPAAAIDSPRAFTALAFLALTGLWAGALYDGFDATTNQVTLPLVGQTIQLGEGEHAERAAHAEHGDHQADDDDD